MVPPFLAHYGVTFPKRDRGNHQIKLYRRYPLHISSNLWLLVLLGQGWEDRERR